MPIGIGLLLYGIPKVFGYPRVGKWLASLFWALLSFVLLYALFEDHFFTKKQAVKLLAEQGILLQDDFELLDNKSMYSPGDYYHVFTVWVSEKDQLAVIQAIRFAPGFKAADPSETLSEAVCMEDSTTIITRNYETKQAFVREMYTPASCQGYAPLFRRVTVRKERPELMFEDIDE